MLEFSSTESCTTSTTSTPLSGFSSNTLSCDGNVALMNDFESTEGCSGQGPQGPDGFSAYQIAVFDGFVGTETQWLASLVGPGVPVGGTAGQILAKIDLTNYNTQWINNTDLVGLTSVGISLPTGLTVSNSPLVANGVLNVAYQSGYSIPTTASQTNWDTAYTNRITSGTSPLSIALNVISITQANTSTNGYLSSTDWNTFNSKFNLPALTTGSVLFSNGTTIAQDNANFYWDDTNNRLGIGTNVPAHPLHTYKSGTGGYIASFNSGASLYANASVTIKSITASLAGIQGLNAGAGAVGAVGINAQGGNVLIGTSTDNGGIVQIKAPGALSTDIALRVRNSADTADLMNIQGDGKINFNSTLAVGNNNFYSSGENRTKFYSTAETTDNLQIYTNGGGYGSSYGEIGFLFKNTSTQMASINFDTRTSVAPFRFFVNPTSGSAIDAMDIFRTGEVGIGTSNTNNGGKLQIRAGGAASTDIALRIRNSGDTADILKISGDNLVSIAGRIEGRGSNTALSFGTQGANVGVLGALGANLWSLGYSVSPDTVQFSTIAWNSSGNVGIGTTAPNTPLEVNGEIRVTQLNTAGSYGRMYNSGGQFIIGANGISNHIGMSNTSNSTYFNQAGFFSSGVQISGSPWYGYVLNLIQGSYTNDDYLRWGTSGKISSAGNLGVGTITPVANLQVSQLTTGYGTVATNGTITLTGTSTQFTNTFKVGDTITVTGETIRTIATIVSDTSLTVSVAFTTTASALAYTLVGGDRFVVLGNGNVGIGTTSPDYLLDVNGHVNLKTNSSAYKIAGYTLLSMNVTGESSYGYFNGITAHRFFTSAGTERLSIISNGNVGIGNTAPSFPLVVGTNTAGTGSDFSVQTSTSAAKLTLSSQSATMSFGANPQPSYTNGVPPGASFGSTTAGSRTTVGCLLTGAGGGTYINFSTNGASSGFHITHNFGADLVTVLSNGNFGIGTTTPTGILEVLATTALPVIIGDSATANFGKIYPNAGGNLTILANGNSGKTLLLNGGNGSNLELKASYDQNGSYNFTSNNYTSTSITGYVLGIHGASIAVASVGTGTPRIVGIDYTINNTAAQTGTATGIFLNATETALNGMAHNLMDLQVGGVSRFKVDNGGILSVGGTSGANGQISFRRSSDGGSVAFIATTGANFYLREAQGSGGELQTYDGTVVMRWIGIGASARLQLGGTTNLFPAIKRNGAGIDFKLADDSGYCDVRGTAINGNSIVCLSAGGVGISQISNVTTYGFHMSRNFVVSWGSNTQLDGSLDTAIARYSANVVRISNASTGAGNLFIGASTGYSASAVLQADSTTQGFLPPRMTQAQILAIVSPANGLEVYNTDIAAGCFWDGTAWRKISHSAM